MKYTTAILTGLMAATVVAQPHVRHQHAARHQKRDVVWVTESEVVTETIDYTTTVWVSSGQVAAPSTSAPLVTPTTLATISESSAAASIPKSTAAASSSSEGAILNQKPSSSYVFVAPPSSTFVSIPAPVTTSAVVVPTTSPTSEAPAIPTTSSIESAVVPTPSSVAPVIPATSIIVPVVVPSSAAPAVVSSSTSAASTSSSGGVCGSGTPCTGDITFYEAGLGACGETTDGSSFSGVALPVGLMGAQSNGNPYCGKTITIKMPTGKTTTATVIDKCMGCMGDAIDLTNFAFDQLAEESVGRTQATWWFNE